MSRRHAARPRFACRRGRPRADRRGRAGRAVRAAGDRECNGHPGPRRTGIRSRRHPGRGRPDRSHTLIQRRNRPPRRRAAAACRPHHRRKRHDGHARARRPAHARSQRGASAAVRLQHEAGAWRNDHGERRRPRLGPGRRAAAARRDESHHGATHVPDPGLGPSALPRSGTRAATRADRQVARSGARARADRRGHARRT